MMSMWLPTSTPVTPAQIHSTSSGEQKQLKKTLSSFWRKGKLRRHCSPNTGTSTSELHSTDFAYFDIVTKAKSDKSALV